MQCGYEAGVQRSISLDFKLRLEYAVVDESEMYDMKTCLHPAGIFPMVLQKFSEVTHESECRCGGVNLIWCHYGRISIRKKTHSRPFSLL